MEGGHAGNPADEAEPDEMLLAADARVGVDLQGVVVGGGILKQTVVRVEQISREKAEPFPEDEMGFKTEGESYNLPGKSSIIKALFPGKSDPESVAHLCGQRVLQLSNGVV